MSFLKADAASRNACMPVWHGRASCNRSLSNVYAYAYSHEAAVFRYRQSSVQGSPAPQPCTVAPSQPLAHASALHLPAHASKLLSQSSTYEAASFLLVLSSSAATLLLCYSATLSLCCSAALPLCHSATLLKALSARVGLMTSSLVGRAQHAQRRSFVRSSLWRCPEPEKRTFVS